MKKQPWRLLFQYKLGLVHAWGTVPPQPKKIKTAPAADAIGGYAEFASSDILGEWTYNYFKPAYGA